MQYHKGFPMMPLPLIPVEPIIDITIVDILNFQKFLFSTMGFTGNCNLFKILAIAKCLQYLSSFNKLNARTKRKTEYFSFLKHPLHQIFTNNIKSIDNDDHHTANAAAATPPSSTAAAMTASEQQTGVITHTNE